MQIQRLEQDFIMNGHGTSWDANVQVQYTHYNSTPTKPVVLTQFQTLYRVLPETAEQYGILERDLAKKLPSYSKRRKNMQQRNRRKYPQFDPFTPAEYIVKPLDSK